MKKLFFLTTLLSTIYFTNSIHAQWTDISLPYIWAVDRASFPDDNHGYVVPSGYDKIFRTNNGGASWDSIIFSGPSIVYDVDFISPDTGFVLAYNTYVSAFQLRTTFDGGNSWEIGGVPIPGFGSYQSIRFTSSTIGFLSTNDAIIFSTSNGGQNWSSPLPVGGYAMSSDKEYTGTDTIIFTGWDGTFAYKGAVTRSDDAGSTWQTYAHDSSYTSFSGTHFLSGQNGYTVYTTGWPTYKNMFENTTDGGISWSTILSDTNSTINFTDVFMTNTTEGYISISSGSTGKILKVNGSSTTVDYSTNYPLRRFYKGGSTLFALGDGGKIVKLALPGFGVEPPVNPLLGIYPNPTSDIINIPIESQSEINVLDINGKIVLSKILSPEEILSLANLANGIYCIKVKNEKGVSSGRIIVNHE